ncbi:MAG: hypothetical protein NTW21_36615 [Verrucomicrobia bacterium]|nr:hypothetical protein [Verrucomicrobiota bacterium]
MDFLLNPGRLLSLTGLHYNLAPKLADLSDLFRIGETPKVIWDLRSAVPGRQSLSALTSLAAICKTVGDYIGLPSIVLHSLDPEILKFWCDVGFIRITRENRSLDWNPNHILEYSSTAPSTNTGIIQISSDPQPPESSKTQHYEWKDLKRLRYSSLFVVRTSMMLQQAGVPATASQEIAVFASELVLNSVTHGKSTAFIAFQDSRRAVSVSVCDAGIGFRNSIRRKSFSIPIDDSFDDLDAIFTGCFVNRQGVGLRGAIDFVVGQMGTVLLSSEKGELLWTEKNWLPLRNANSKQRDNAHYIPLRIREHLGDPHQGSVSPAESVRG